MSYAVSEALQTALYTVLRDAGLPVFDELPSGSLPELYVTLGPETVRDRSGFDAPVARHDVTISVVSSGSGFRAVKAMAASVADTLDNARPVLERGSLVGLTFLRAKAVRTSGEAVRRIDLTFRALVEDDAQTDI